MKISLNKMNKENEALQNIVNLTRIEMLLLLMKMQNKIDNEHRNKNKEINELIAKINEAIV